MQIYLPIAETSVALWTLIAIGGGVGLLSGLFGVGGGFLLTPLLLVIGIPPAVAVATGVNQVIGSSFSAMLNHWKRKTVDAPMGFVLLGGGMAGSIVGVWGFNLLRALGQIDLVISILYIVLLGIVGGLMLIEGIRALSKKMPPARPGGKRRRRRHMPRWLRRMPLLRPRKFERSGISVPPLLPITIGFVIGLLAALLGIGGGFIMIPAMIYLLKMPTGVVVGTSLFQIVFVSAFSTILHAATSGTVDIVLAIVLMLGGVVGAQLGSVMGARLRGEQLRILLALVVLSVAGKLFLDLVLTPSEAFSVSEAIL